MVVKEDGTKWSCSSCLKGHRVSSCQHTDRELTLVPKKGRPVTQCQHCRQERKKRSAHVSCDCGSTEKQHHPKEKCVHLREAEERAKAGYGDDQHAEKDPAHLAAVAEEQGCCCHHGGKCTCALLKKENEDGSGTLHGPAVKPRLEKTSSDTSITVFTNGHHKPVHRKNHAAHECGMPYKMPMPRFHTEQAVSHAARRSVDSLALDTNMAYQPSAFTPQTTAPFNTERRKSKSEQPSPKLGPTSGCSGLADNKLNSVDFTPLSQTQTNQSYQSTMSESFGFPSYDNMSSVTDGNFEWSAVSSADAGGLPNNNYFGVWPTSNDNVNMGQPALTAASSGTTSEIDEMPQMEDVYGVPMPSIQEDADFDLINIPTGNSPQTNRRSLPPSFFGNVDLTMPGLYPDFQTPVESFNTNIDNKPRTQQSNMSSSYDESWQMPTSRQISSVAQRALGGLPAGSRPPSRSVGHASGPGDDIIRQLFPDIDINTNTFGPTSSPQMNFSNDKSMTGLQISDRTASPVEYSPMDADVGFTSRPFSDGSLSIPNDTFTSSYDLDQDFSNPDFSGNWSQ